MADNIISRLMTGIRMPWQSVNRGMDIDTVSKQLDLMIANGELPSADSVVKELKSRPLENKSKLEVRESDNDKMLWVGGQYFYDYISKFGSSGSIPPYGDPHRDFELDKLWHQEPLLAGAVYSMAAKMTALSWQITGRRNLAKKYAELFARAAHMDGYDWGGFIASVANDFYVLDRGAFIETARDKDARLSPEANRLIGPLAEMGHIDALMCTLTGNRREPMMYVSETTGQRIRFKPGEYMHFASMPSPREADLGIGYSAVSRAYRAAKLLMGLHDYDEQKLSNLPPEGVAAVTGLTMTEFMDALKIWRAAREQNNSLTFPQVLWLIGSQPNAKVGIDFVGFSQLPEHFDRQTVVTQYMNTLALVFGVDAREFWPVSTSSLGTAAESEIQHTKAKGKGSGELISITERHLNGELPDGVDFAYDTRDVEEDKTASEIAAGWIGALLPLYQSQAGIPEDAKQPEPLITKDQFLRLLIDKGVLPDYLSSDNRTAVDDSMVHIKENNTEFSCFVWKDGTLREKRIDPIIVNTVPVSDLPYATISKQEPKQKSKIHGNPIPEQEVEAGTRVTPNAIQSELERWQNSPELAPFALQPDEMPEYVERTLRR